MEGGGRDGPARFLLWWTHLASGAVRKSGPALVKHKDVLIGLIGASLGHDDVDVRKVRGGRRGGGLKTGRARREEEERGGGETNPH